MEIGDQITDVTQFEKDRLYQATSGEVFKFSHYDEAGFLFYAEGHSARFIVEEIDGIDYIGFIDVLDEENEPIFSLKE